MGKNKWFTEMEAGGHGPYRSNEGGGTARSKKPSSLPGIFFGSNKEDDITFRAFLQSFLKRFRRKWLSLKFRGNQVSGSVFSKTVILKVGFLAVAAYFVLGGGEGTAAALDLDRSVEETNLGVGMEKKKPVVKKPKKQPKSDAAPVSTENLSGDRSAEYIRAFSGIAREEMRRFGIPASISLAQGLIESRAGTSKLAVTNNNHFGMKCFSRNCKKGHCTNFTDDSHKDFFLKFNTPQQSWNAHSKLLASGRYARLKKYGRDYKRWALGLKSIGYATDRTYAQKLIGVIERYNLHQFDR